MHNTALLRLATDADFPDLYDLLDRCFDMERGEIAERFPHCFDRSNPQRHAVIEYKGALVSHAACIPQTLVIGSSSIPCWGIAAVATDRRHRGMGYMTSLMEFWTEQLTEKGIPLSDLGGNRLRYNRFGWERTGTELRYTLDLRNVEEDAEFSAQIQTYRGNPDHSELLQSIHEADDLRVDRDLEGFADRLTSRGRETLLYLDSDEPAYLVFTRGDRDRTVHEFGGSTKGIRALLSHVVTVYDTDNLSVVTHPAHETTELFAEISNRWTLRPNRMIRIFDLFAVLEVFEEQMTQRWTSCPRSSAGTRSVGVADDGVGVEIAYSDESVEVTPIQSDPDIVADRVTMARLLFGFESQYRFRGDDPFLDAVLPLKYYIGRPDCV